MGSKKLVLCCIAGIILGFIAPFIFGIPLGTSLSIGMVAGLGIGYLLDINDERQGKQASAEQISEKAKKANRLLEQARAEISGETGAEDKRNITEDENTVPEIELTEEEEVQKLNEAQELLRQARAEISGEKLDSEETDESAAAVQPETSPAVDDEAEKLNEAQELLRQARERMNH